MISRQDIEKLVRNAEIRSDPDVNQTVLRDLLEQFDDAEAQKPAAALPNVRRTILKSPTAKLAAAAVLIIALVLSVNLWEQSIPSAAAQVLTEAAKAAANLRSVYIKAQIRTTIGHDNFELIGLDYDFVPNEMWKEFDGTPQGKWRIEKPGRVVVMDGEGSLLLIRPNQVAKDGIRTGFVQWLQNLLDVDKIIDSQLESARKYGWELELRHEEGEEGREKLVVIVEAKAQGDFTNDWLKNQSVSESDNRRVYWFDAETKLLEGLEVYVHAEDEDVLILEITDIEYNLDIDPALFTLELPEDVIWFEQPRELADNEKYEQMGPEETARAFFQACADENWDEFVKFFLLSEVDERLRNIMGGLELISIGKPFKSGLWPGWFVPCEIKRRHEEESSRHNLAVRYDKKAKRYIVTGGF